MTSSESSKSRSFPPVSIHTPICFVNSLDTLQGSSFQAPFFKCKVKLQSELESNGSKPRKALSEIDTSSCTSKVKGLLPTERMVSASAMAHSERISDLLSFNVEAQRGTDGMDPDNFTLSNSKRLKRSSNCNSGKMRSMGFPFLFMSAKPVVTSISLDGPLVLAANLSTADKDCDAALNEAKRSCTCSSSSTVTKYWYSTPNATGRI
mmetsp:Transcript_28292/g.50117  ORF Transcript_28292/g.50117 Transcript_28292/m.50117 type:complete len:207 (+) Transcript_28292:1774-2394(+)